MKKWYPTGLFFSIDREDYSFAVKLREDGAKGILGSIFLCIDRRGQLTVRLGADKMESGEIKTRMKE